MTTITVLLPWHEGKLKKRCSQAEHVLPTILALHEHWPPSEAHTGEVEPFSLHSQSRRFIFSTAQSFLGITLGSIEDAGTGQEGVI